MFRDKAPGHDTGLSGIQRRAPMELIFQPLTPRTCPPKTCPGSHGSCGNGRKCLLLQKLGGGEAQISIFGEKDKNQPGKMQRAEGSSGQWTREGGACSLWCRANDVRRREK